MDKGSNYRQLYKEWYGIEFGRDMAVHHIDYDRTNNEIDNLLLLPMELHIQYHVIMSHLGGNGNGQIEKVLLKPRQLGESDKAKCLKTLSETIERIKPWINFKLKLDAKKKYIPYAFPPVYEASTELYGLTECCTNGDTLVLGRMARRFLQEPNKED